MTTGEVVAVKSDGVPGDEKGSSGTYTLKVDNHHGKQHVCTVYTAYSNRNISQGPCRPEKKQRNQETDHTSFNHGVSCFGGKKGHVLLFCIQEISKIEVPRVMKQMPNSKFAVRISLMPIQRCIFFSDFCKNSFLDPPT